MLKLNTVCDRDFINFLTFLCTLLELTGISIENDWVFTWITPQSILIKLQHQ